MENIITIDRIIEDRAVKKFLLFTASDLVSIFITTILICSLSLIIFKIGLFGLAWEFIKESIVYIIIVLIALVDKILVNKKITRFRSSPKRIILLFRDDGGPMIYRKPVWGKYSYKVIEINNKFKLHQQSGEYNLDLSLKIDLLDRELYLPFQFKLKSKNIFDAWDFYGLIMMQESKEKKVYKFDKCLRNIFTKFNKLYLEKEMYRVCESLLESGNHNEALKCIAQSVSFPQHLLSAQTSINLIHEDVKIIQFDREYPLY